MLVVTGDVTGTEFPAEIVSATIKAFGSIDIVINNAGMKPLFLAVI